VARVPVQHGFCLGDRRQMVRLDQTLHGDRAQVGHEQVVARFQCFGRGLRDAVAETAGAAEMPEEHRLGRRRERLRFRNREQRIVHRRALFHHDQVAADHIAAGLWVGG